MKNLQKGSAKIWLITLIVVVVLAGGFLIIKYVMPESCTINGVPAAPEKCKIADNAAGNNTEAAQSDYDKAGQAMKQVESNNLKNSPPDF